MLPKVTKIQLLVSHYVRNQLESLKDNLHVALSLKRLIESFTTHIIKSKILTLKEDVELMELLLNKSINISYVTDIKLLYESKETKWNRENFYRKCADQSATITIVKTLDGKLWATYSTTTYSDKSDHQPTYSDDLGYADSHLFLIEGESVCEVSVKDQQWISLPSNHSEAPSIGGIKFMMMAGLLHFVGYHSICGVLSSDVYFAFEVSEMEVFHLR